MDEEKTLDEQVVGMDVEAAIKLIKDNSFQARIMMIDNEPQMGTMDVVPDRFNLEVVANKVVRVSGRG